MAATTFRIIVIGILGAALVAAPSTVAAQNSTFIVPFDTAFDNPCTREWVDVTGSSTITISESVTPQGEQRKAVSVVTKGSGTGRGPLYATYAFMENQNFSVKAPMLGEAFDSSFSDKLAMKGAGSVDNWVIRAYFRIKIDALGTILVSIERMNADVCKG